MLQRFRDRFGPAGLVVAIGALVLALAGGAYAASGALTGKQKKEVEKIAKKFQGTGPAGAAGAKGDSGAAGAPGKDGTNGTNGKSAETVTFAGVKGSCTEGGIEVKSASPTVLVCNGKQGEPGPLLETLPKGKSMKGNWAITLNSAAIGSTGISFPFPLPNTPTAHRIKPGQEGIEFATDCPGSVGEPEAAEGFLCLYSFFESTALGTAQFSGTSTVGASMSFFGDGTAGAVAAGNWAVTAN